MGKFVLLDARIFADGADLTSNTNKVELMSEVEEKDATAFGSAGWKELLGGLASSALAGEGQWEAGDPSKVDDQSYASLGGAGAWTLGPDGASVDGLAWLLHGMRSSYTLGGTVGDVAPWTGKAVSTWPLVRGKIAHPPGTPRTVSGSGTAVAHVAVPAGKHLYAALHVLSVAGTATPTITVKVQSDDSGAFPSPADRITFAAATTQGGQILRAAGPITDTFYRAVWTITGTAPSFLFVVSFGVA